MIPPSLKELQRISDSKYAIVLAVAKRARTLSELKRKEEDWRLSSMVALALEELQEGKMVIKYKADKTQSQH